MSVCATETTVPRILKQIVDPTTTNSSVCCSATQCMKTFADVNIFMRELRIYKRNLPYVPRLISYDRTARTITVERVGTPLGTVWDSGVPFVGSILNTPSRSMFNARIRKLSRRFQRDTGMYHNDICYKNVLRDGKRLYLIDFERCGTAFTDANMDGILSHSRPRVEAIVSVLVGLYIVRGIRRDDRRIGAYEKLLLGLLVLILVAYAFLNSIPISTVGASLPTDPCLVIFNHPFPYVDVAIADTFIRRQRRTQPTHILVEYPHSIAHQIFTFAMSNDTITMPAHAKNRTTDKVVQQLKNGNNVAAFYARHKQQHGLFWAMLETNIPTYTVRIEKTIWYVEPVEYDADMNVAQIRTVVRRQLGY